MIRLEAEIEEARMKANEAALAEIQAAKEEAQLLLSQQKTTFEDQLKDMAQKMASNYSALEEHEKGRQVDRDKIAELEVTKQSLEDELIANKHLLYMHKLTTEKAEEERRAKQTRLIANLEAEKQKIEDDVAKLKQSKLQRERVKTSTPSETKLPTAGAAAPRRKDLLRISLLLREANNISSNLNKCTTFQREDVVIDGQLVTKIRLHNTKLGITTVWSLTKFESRLEQMREVYEGEHKTDSEDLFYDPQDDWQKDLAVPTTPSPVVNLRSIGRRAVSSPKLQELPSSVPKSLQELLASQINASPLSTVKRRLSTESLSTPLSEFGHSTSSRLSLDNSSAVELTVKDVLKDVQPVPSICRTNVSAALSRLDNDAAVTLFKQRTLADRVLEQCQSVKIAATALLQSFDNCSTSLKVPLYETNDVRSYCIEANVALELLVEQVIIWTTEQAEGNMDSQLSRELKAKLRDVTRKVGVNVARLMQGMVTEIESVVRDSGSNVLEGITALAMEAGTLAIATCKRVEYGRQPQSRLQLKDEKVDDELKMAFRQGGERFVERRFQNARDLVHTAGIHCKELQSHSVTVPPDLIQCVRALVEAVTVLTDNAGRFQMEYLPSADDDDSVSSYRNYRQIRGIVGEVSDIADAIHTMTKACSENRMDKVLALTKTVAECSVHLLDICQSKSSPTPSSADVTLDSCIRSVIRSTKAVSQGAKNLVRSSPMPPDSGTATKQRYTPGHTMKPQQSTSAIDTSCDTS
jgi:kinesin family protein 14